MNRRALLRTVGAAGVAGTTALAGCAAPGPHVEIGDVVDVPESYGVSIDVELPRPQFTSDHPARLRTTVTNHDSSKQLSASGDAMCGLFDRSKAGSRPAGLWLHPPRVAEEIEQRNGRWVRDRDPDRMRGVLSYGCSLVTYAAGESRSQPYDIWHDYRSEGYLVPGTYRWEVAVEVTDSGEERTEAEAFDWGFSINLS